MAYMRQRRKWWWWRQKLGSNGRCNDRPGRAATSAAATKVSVAVAAISATAAAVATTAATVSFTALVFVGGVRFRQLVLILTLVSIGLGRRIGLGSKIPFYLLQFYLFAIRCSVKMNWIYSFYASTVRQISGEDVVSVGMVCE